MANYAILDIETDTLYGCYSMFSIIRFEYITERSE